MSKKFKTALEYVLISEGVIAGKKGNVDHPKDEGGRTGSGILQREYDKYRKAKGLTTRDVWEIEDRERDDIYKRNYWLPMNCEKMPYDVAYVVFDSAVLHGVNFTRKAVQRALNVKVDGIIGPMTLAAAKAVDPRLFWKRFRIARWKRMKSRKSFPTFKKGWTKRLNDVEANLEELLTHYNSPDPAENKYDPFVASAPRC